MDKRTLEAAKTLFDLAYAEDIGDGDVTTNNLIPLGQVKTARLVAKAEGIVAGLPVVEMVFSHFDKKLVWTEVKKDGDAVKKGDVIAEFSAGYRALLTGERIALNFLQRISGIATLTNRFVRAVEGSGVQILDTRKTLPAYRLLDKYAVKAGGGTNHRMGLYDMVMIKDNHIQVAGGIGAAVAAIREKTDPAIKVEVETTTLEQVKDAIAAGADIVMLDNMDTATMAEAVRLIGGRAKVEASGNMTLDRVAEVARTGVDYISIGALTHSVEALDISQQIID